LLTSIPVTNLLVILVGMPLAATVPGWLLAGRDPAGIARQPLGLHRTQPGVLDSPLFAE
jgi:hypothetical protein